jgi:hypothetical protein
VEVVEIAGSREKRGVCKYWKILQCEKFLRTFEDA